MNLGIILDLIICGVYIMVVGMMMELKTHLIKKGLMMNALNFSNQAAAALKSL